MVGMSRRGGLPFDGNPSMREWRYADRQRQLPVGCMHDERCGLQRIARRGAVDCTVPSSPALTVLAAGPRPTSVVIDACSVYWTDAKDGGVYRVSKNGG